MDHAHIAVIGAGQLGSRHLQALHAVKHPLRIQVIDPSPQSLQTAQERYESLGPSQHQVRYSEALDASAGQIDIAIVATNADYRRAAVETALQKNEVKFFILEKYLFNKRADYQAVHELLKKHHSQAWVNCSMRTQTIYASLKQELGGAPVDFIASGSQYGLITNAIHFLDYLAFLTDQDEFTVDTSSLDQNPIPSKRKGWLELNGTLRVYGAKHSSGTFICYPTGTAPIFMSFLTPQARYLTRDAEQKAFVAKEETNWTWSEIPAPVPFQSAMTTKVVEKLLADGTCSLTPYDLSMKLHLTLLEALHKFLHEKTDYRAKEYPFT